MKRGVGCTVRSEHRRAKISLCCGFWRGGETVVFGLDYRKGSRASQRSKNKRRKNTTLGIGLFGKSCVLVITDSAQILNKSVWRSSGAPTETTETNSRIPTASLRNLTIPLQKPCKSTQLDIEFLLQRHCALIVTIRNFRGIASKTIPVLAIYLKHPPNKLLTPPAPAKNSGPHFCPARNF